MKKMIVIVTLLMAVGGTACTKKNAAAPTSTTTTSIATTTTTAASTTTTSIAAPTQFTLTGLITDQATGLPVPLADIEIVEGANVGRTFRTDANGLYSAPNLNPGTFTMRVRAFGYPSTDVRVTLANANLRVDVQLTPNPVSTTTTTTIPPALRADFLATPDPCTISGPTAIVDCTVDATPSVSAVGFLWTYKGKTVMDNARFMLQLACSDLGSSTDDTVSVTLTVTDSGGGTDTVTKGVVIKKINGACP